MAAVETVETVETVRLLTGTQLSRRNCAQHHANSATSRGQLSALQPHNSLTARVSTFSQEVSRPAKVLNIQVKDKLQIWK